MMLQRAQEDVHRYCRLLALDILTKFVHLVDDHATLIHIFPGVVSALYRLILHADYKLGSKVPSRAIDCLAHVLSLTMADTRWHITAPTYHLKDAIIAPAPATAASGRHDHQESSSWLATTQSNLAKVLSSICTSQRHHAKARIRTSLASLCIVVLDTCRWTLVAAFFPAFETLLSFEHYHHHHHHHHQQQQQQQQQPHDEPAVTTVQAYCAAWSDDEATWFHDQASARLLLQLKEAEKVVDSNESGAEACFHVCVGYLEWSPLLLVVDHGCLHDMMTCCQRLFKIDTRMDLQVLAHVTFIDPVTKTSLTTAYYKHRFVRFRNDETLQWASQFVQALSARCLSHGLWMDYLLSKLMEDPEV